MISKYEQERLRNVAEGNAERVRRIEKGQEMWTKAQNLLQQRGQDFRGLDNEKLEGNDFNVRDWFSEAYSVRYLVEDVDLGEEEPTTVVIKSFERKKGPESSTRIHLWAEDMHYCLGLFKSPSEPERYYRITDSTGKPVFDRTNNADHADMKLLELYDHVLDRLEAKVGAESTSE